MAITICLTEKPNVGLIIGPPGSGKTNVICNIIINLMSNVQTKPKLLICAPSNDAVDAIVRRVLEVKKDLKRKYPINFTIKYYFFDLQNINIIKKTFFNWFR